jgi:hypothetical protein
MKLIPAFNCEFHLKKGGKLTIFATDNFTPKDAIRTYDMARLHAKWKKLKKPIKWRIVPTLH